jgi:hypothetical protein
MAHDFDPGPVSEPFASLAQNYPGADVYPANSFRVEWGPIFHRGRLDGSARLLVIGQDPAESESIARRILVGEAGHRTQGLIAKLGFNHSYLMINTFLYSVYGQTGGTTHENDPGIVGYRNQWLDAIFAANQIEAVVALGQLASDSWQTWSQTANGKKHSPPFAHVTHPTQPESASGGNSTKLRQLIEAMLANWNQALAQLHPQISNPDTPGPLVPYGSTFKQAERVEIPEFDVPAGLPEWMRSPNNWADRVGKSAAAKRRNITITVPSGVV